MKMRRLNARRCTSFEQLKKTMVKSRSNFVSGLYLELLFDELDIKALEEDREIQEALDEASWQVRFYCLFIKNFKDTV